MSTTFILHIFLLIPLIGFIVSLLINKSKEALISVATYVTVGSHFLLFLVFFIYWLTHGHEIVNLKDFVLFRTTGYEFYLDFYFDKITAVYLFVGSSLTLLITIYSRYYMHREEGYKRFFNTLLFFYLGYNITIFSGNLETLFIGWEILGICSFLLIAFYRDRFLPVRNALKVYTVYRVGDIGLILAMWMGHHLWHRNITFFDLSNNQLVHEQLTSHSLVGVFISLMILITAAAKSAQLPFSSWLPRAMEGPTPSSAIFYGSLSVHFGVFLLLRTYNLWENQYSVRILIGLLGLSTSIVATLIARVQSSVKSQIAYSSAAQIGLIFIEVALGLDNVALVHFAGNAFLRTYQLLVSPSVASYLIREQFYNYIPRTRTIEDSWPKKIEYSVYLLSLKEFNLDLFMARFLWNPLKNLGRKLNFFTLKSLFLFFLPAYLIGLTLLYTKAHIAEEIHEYLPVLFAIIGLMMVLKAFSETKNVTMSWILIIMNHFWVALAVSFNETFNYGDVHVYLSGIVVAGIVGLFFLRRIKSFEHHLDLSRFHGHVYEHPKTALIFLLACLGLTGFPISPTFIGEDLIFSHIKESQYALAIIISVSFIIDGLALVRIYARVFLGPHIKTYHETPYKSS
ncbi:proton-conducting transporter transmembrane domain-containing protein [Aurantibacillus circumpalustris]|uniref:proton-conducting transporter transmembrane domain-containing protein n=1 Tax=Aurantibacillus circumpalustris TaxID=3036359 RepID=UPI00295AC749|nr:proton-conducting transporter membrane subunit [Aurantibacillus circumpalustris]